VRDDPTLERYGAVGWPGDARRIGIAIARTARDLGFTLLVGELDGRAVASATTVVTDGLAGIYNVVVEPEYRRRGVGTAMTWAAVAAGLDRGAKNVWLGSSDIARPMYLKMGFEPHFEYAHLRNK
jgi:predicted GNAT family acetyltransferase